MQRLFLVLLICCLPTATVYAQAESCQATLQQAEQAYNLGDFDETIRLVDTCLDNTSVSEAERQFGFRLKGLSYIGKGLETDARAAVRRLLELVPSFQADPVQDPPTFITLIEEVKQEMGVPAAALPVDADRGIPSQRNARDTRNRVESWYTNWGLGYPVIQYPDELQPLIDSLTDLGFDNVSLTLELLGFYFPIGTKTIVGTALNAWGDQYSAGGESLQVTAVTFGGSVMHFLQHNIGDGIFVRGDVGAARLVFDSSLDDQTTSDWGLGILVGGGYGIPVSRETRILLHLNYSFRRVEGETYGNLGFGATGLF